MNVVLDTNTVISGLFWKGAPRQVLEQLGYSVSLQQPALCAAG